MKNEINSNNLKDKILLFLLLIGMGLSIYGFIQKQFSLFVCETDGCAIANTLIQINPTLLYVFAFSFFLILFCLKIKKISETIFNLFLFSGITFEVVLFSNMVFVHNEVCQECAKMVSLLLVIGLVSNYKYLIMPLAVTAATFILNPVGENIVFDSKYTLITKVDCPHCKKAKEYLQKQNIEYKEVNYKNALNLLKTFKINSVPVLILKKEQGIEVVNGDINIEKCIQELNYIEDPKNEENQLHFLQENKDFFNQNFEQNSIENGIILNDQPGGCSIVTEENDCNE